MHPSRILPLLVFALLLGPAAASPVRSIPASLHDRTSVARHASSRDPDRVVQRIPLRVSARISVAQQVSPRVSDRIDVLLDRTREMLDLADEQIRGCGGERARDLVERAMELQARAEDALQDGRRLAALQLTRAARERGLEALALCGFQEDVPSIAERALDRTDRLLARERPWPGRARALDRRFVGGERFGSPTRDRAAELQDAAWREFRAGRFESSLRLSLAARSLARRGIRPGR